MFLPQAKIRHINSIAHEGKVIVFATDADGKIYYTIKQDGFEDSYGHTEVTGWENWQELTFPQEADDPSVIAKQKKELTYTDGNSYLIKSLYDTQNYSDLAPVQLVSGLGHLYVFRQSKAKTLLVDRFVLDGLENKLVRKLEVRFKRSRQKHQPLQNSNGKGRNPTSFDSLDFRDSDGKPFYEPTTEISLVHSLYQGWFSVVLVPTSEHDKYRWHIFAYNRQTQNVELTSIRASREGLFDVTDETVLEPLPGDEETLIPRSIPGIIKRSLKIENVAVANGLAATKYDIQVERQTEAGLQLLRENTRLMLVIPTQQGYAAALSFAIGKDGTLAQIDETPQTVVHRSNDHHVLLPLNTLDEIKAIAPSNPSTQGSIVGMERGEGDRVKIISPQSQALQNQAATAIKISGTTHYNGHYVAKKIDQNTFEIESPWQESELGNWEVLPPEESSLIFDGIITAVEQTSEGKLRVTSLNHGLENGDEVQIVDTQAYNGLYPVTEIGKDGFTIDLQWQPGETVNLKMETRKRRGITFTGDRAYMSTPPLPMKSPYEGVNFGATYSAWVSASDRREQTQLILGQKDELVQLLIADGKVVFKVGFADGIEQVVDPSPVDPKTWIHYAGVISYNKRSQTTTLSLCRNGKAVAKQEFAKMAMPHLKALQAAEEQNSQSRNGQRLVLRWTPEFNFAGSETGDSYFAGKLSDLQIWNIARTPQEIKDSMYLQLTGREVGLVGYWRLGAIAEEKERKVIDFSINSNDATVYGDAFASAVTLERTLRDGKTQAIKYSNPELFAVTQRATYLESFEFRGAKPRQFEFSYWGKSSRSSEERIDFESAATEFEDLGNGWYRAACRFTIPDDISLVRSFEISNLQGDWKALEIRKHRIRLVSDAVTEVNYADKVSLAALHLGDEQKELEAILKQLTPIESQELALLKEKRQLEADLASLRNPGDSRKQLEREIADYKNKVKFLKKQVDRATEDYTRIVNNPLNYYCYIVSNDSGKVWDIEGRTGRNKADIHLWDKTLGLHTQQWRFERAGGGYYKIVNRQFDGYVADVEGDQDRNKADIHLWEKTSKQPKQEWKLEQVNGRYVFVNRLFSQRVASVEGNPNRNKADVHLWERVSGGYRQQWRLEKTNDVSNNSIERSRNSLERIQQKLQSAKAKLRQLEQRLQRLKADNREQIKALEERLKVVLEQLKKIQAEFNRLNNQFLKGVVLKQAPQPMPQLFEDSRGLVTKGALLEFVRPVSRIHAIETSEGQVQLSYFDAEGRMRQTNFDATSDSKNATFEQWIPDSLRACLNFDQSDSKMQVENPIPLDDNWTIETWFTYPLPETKAWNTLTRAKDTADHQIIVKDGKHLGTYVDRFYGIEDYDLENLAPGWHHLAAVGREIDSESVTVFYIDGVEVGQVKAKSTSNIHTIGNYLHGGQPFGKLSELRIWQVALSAEEIEVNSKTLLSGNEPGLIAYYPITEAKGTEVRDYTGSDHACEVTKANWVACTAPIGNPGHSVMQFDGNGDYIEAGKIDLSGQALTISAWVKVFAFEEESPYISTIAGIETSAANTALLRIGDWNLKNNQLQFVLSIAGKQMKLNSKTQLQAYSWYHVAATYDGQKMALFINGEQDSEIAVSGSFSAKGTFKIATSWDGRYLNGCLADVCLWKQARSRQNLQTDLRKRLTGDEANLMAYWPLNAVNMQQSPYTVSDFTGNHDGTVHDAIATRDNTLPIGQDALISTEYSTIGIEPETQKRSAMMRRFFASPTLGGVQLFPDKRIEFLELRWIGNAQFQPTLLGYIEGAPPVPSENLTIADSYDGATSVELAVSEGVTYSWSREQEVGKGFDSSLFVGVDDEIEVGGGLFGLVEGSKTAFKTRVGFQGDLSLNYSQQRQSNISATSSSSISDRIELRGAQEQKAKFAHLGKRYVPKNVGYALVVSGLADVYITRLQRSQKMVGYQVLPNSELPLDVNTITFLMNPTYVKNGSLDGLVGSYAADERFYQHVPEMRSQYGSLYPASYYRLQEAYALRQKIDQLDRERASYFANFNSLLVDEASIKREIDGNGSASQPKGYEPIQIDNPEDLERDSQRVQAEGDHKRQEIEAKIQEQDKRTHASASFASWQRNLENLQIRAGKRNIVNNYVWDADGGFRTEQQEFASTIEHTVGGSFSFDAGIGQQNALFVGGVGFDLTAQATTHLTQTVSKTEQRSTGLALNVALGSGSNGVESVGVTDSEDRPLLPGEKVGRYRFMSFYLEGNTQHFQDFFSTVVDPEWLRTNSEEARALRQTMAGRANKVWRVLHRVTYVERPALMGFSNNLR